MCILFVRHCSPSDAASGGYQLIVAANRDELLGRPARAADFWPEPYSHVLAGENPVVA